jgi:hypothetical protein
VISDVEMTKPTGNSPQPGQPGESAAGGFEEGPMNTNKPGEKRRSRTHASG